MGEIDKRSLSAGKWLLFVSALTLWGGERGFSNESSRTGDLPASPSVKLIRSDYEKDEITKLCGESVELAESKLTAIVQLSPAERNIENTLLAFEETVAEVTDKTNALLFMGYVSTDPNLRDEGMNCEESVSTFLVKTSARRDLYQAIKGQNARNLDEKRLLDQTLLAFEQNGMNLNDENLAKFVELNSLLSSKSVEFSKNLNSDHSFIEVTREELSGLDEKFIDRLEKREDKYIVYVNEANYPAIMENCTNEQTRFRVLQVNLNRAGERNTQLLEEAVVLRSQIAKLVLGSDKVWADYRISGRMAKDRQAVEGFLKNLKEKLAEKNRQDLNELLEFKKSLDPSATKINMWDINFLANQLRKKNFSIDGEVIREYFPAEVVIDGLFKVYSNMFGVRFQEVPGAKVWSPDVKLFEIHDKKDEKLIAYFYADFFPREGKYDHAAAFSLISGRTLADGNYSVPVSSIVANFTPPSSTLPSLLSHDEVETAFHEFGHIMHQTLTRAPYASLAGSSVARDFVEAPSQMLENWVWQPEVLNLISGHYKDHSQKLPPDLLEKMISARKFQQAYFYTKQLLYGTFDMTIHTQDGPVDVTKTFNDLYKEIIGVDPIEGNHFPASFGHMMGGYDAGYYGYIWSEVYAQDMFSRFKSEGIDSPIVGGQYRKSILESGNMADGIDLLKSFLGREPSDKAFLEKLGIN